MMSYPRLSAQRSSRLARLAVGVAWRAMAVFYARAVRVPRVVLRVVAVARAPVLVL